MDNFSIKNKQEVDTGSFNIRWMLTTLLATWPYFMGSIILALVCANLYLRYTTPIYKLSTEIMLNETNGKSSKNDELILEGLGLSNRNNDINNITRVLKSKPLMLKVVNKLRLNLQYFEYGNVKTTQFYGASPFKIEVADSVLQNCGNASYKITFESDKKSYTIADDKNSWKGKIGVPVNIPVGEIVVHNSSAAPIKPGAKYAFVFSNALGMAVDFASGVDVNRPDKAASYVNIAILDEIPARGKDILDTLVYVYTITNIEDRNRTAINTIDFITDRLKRVEEELVGQEKKIEIFKTNKRLTGDVVDQSKVLVENTNENFKELYNKEVQLEVINSLEKLINNENSNENVVPASMLEDNGSFSKIAERYNEAVHDKERLSLTKTETHPQVIAAKKQLESLRSDMRQSLVSTKRSLQVVIGELKKQNGTIDAQIRQVPQTERIYLDYARRQHLMEELFLYLLKKREETEVAKSSTAANITVINTAENNGAIKPNRSRIKSTAVLIGFLIPILILILRRMLNTRIITKNDINTSSEIPIIGEIGHSDNEDSVAVKNNSHSALSEQFRALRTNIQFLLPDKNDKTIMLTSSMSGEGKSFIAINLASTFAISGKKVVLMELDLRKPKISKNLGLSNSIGLSSYAVGQSEIKDIIQPSGFEDNLFVISSGPVPPNPAELIMLQRIDELFAYLRENFDYIIIDTAPAGLVTDALLLNRFANATLYVVRQGYTFRQQLQIPNDLQADKKINRLSFVINDVIFKRGYTYGYGYGYGKYSNGYFEEEENKSPIKKVVKKLTQFLPRRK